jgi:hypothetical protein
MYDTTFDHDRDTVPRTDRGALWALRLLATAAILGIVYSAGAEAQMPGAPVLQNAWATPGIVGALDIAGGPDGSVYAAAASWTPGMGRFQISGGLGFQSRSGSSSRAVYGARVAIPLGGAASTFGFGAFAGIGGGAAAKATSPDSTPSTMQIPVGAALGWRHAIGANHGLSVYATPSYVFFSGGSSTGGLFRTSIGADFGITSSLGATAGVEFGASRGKGVGGPSGTLYGLGISYALGHR